MIGYIEGKLISKINSNFHACWLLELRKQKACDNLSCSAIMTRLVAQAPWSVYSSTEYPTRRRVSGPERTEEDLV